MPTLTEQFESELKKNKNLQTSVQSLGGAAFSSDKSADKKLAKLIEVDAEYTKQKALFDQRLLSQENLFGIWYEWITTTREVQSLLKTVSQSSNDLATELLTLHRQSAVKSQPSRAIGKKKKPKFRLKLKQFSSSYKPKPISALTAGERLTNLTSLSSFKSLSALKPLTV